MNWTIIRSGASVLTLVAATATLAEEQKLPQGVDVSSSTFRAERRDFNDAYLNRLQLPPGFQVNVFATGVLPLLDVPNAWLLSTNNVP